MAKITSQPTNEPELVYLGLACCCSNVRVSVDGQLLAATCWQASLPKWFDNDGKQQLRAFVVISVSVHTTAAVTDGRVVAPRHVVVVHGRADRLALVSLVVFSIREDERKQWAAAAAFKCASNWRPLERRPARSYN